MSLCIFSADSLHASWKRIAQFATTINASFFFNEQRGFIGMDGQNGMFRTSDGGKSWQTCNIPTGYLGFITDIYMKDSLNGWASVEEFGNLLAKGAWVTTDGGVNWTASPVILGMFTCVYQTPFALVLGDRYSFNGLSIETLPGSVLQRKSREPIDGVNFTDDLHGVATVMSAGPPINPTYYPVLWTDDGGLSWNPAQSALTEAWGLYAEKGTSNFLICGEKSTYDGSTSEEVRSSSDNGVTWGIISQIPERTTGHIAGVGPVSYIQTGVGAPNPTAGFLRSTDRGRTWKDVGGPENYRDTRFSVTGCLGGVVYAFDPYGGIWRTEDGGDGDIHEPPHNPNYSPNHLDLSSTMCSIATATLKYNNLSCNPLTIESIEFIDSTDPIVSTGALSFTRYPTLPQNLDPTTSDFLTLTWDPQKLGVAKPLSTTYVKIHSSMLNGTMVFDTLVAINSQSIANQPVFSLSATKVKFDSLNMCQRLVDTTISFTNQSCDTLWLDSSIFTSSADWQLLDPVTLLPLTLPLGLAHGGTASFIIRFTPSVVGAQVALLRLHFLHQGIIRDTSLIFSDFSYRVVDVRADAKIDFAPASICITQDSVITLHNYNCDTLTIDGLTNNNPLAFVDISGITFPFKIGPAEAMTYKIHFNGLKNILSNALVVFHYHIAEDTNIVETSLQGMGLPGSSLFETTPGQVQLSFPDRIACSLQDSISFTIDNPGCDSLSVLSSTISGFGLPAINYRTEPPLPAILSQPGQSVRVTIYLQAQNPSTNDGTLDFTYRLADGSIHDSIFTIHAIVSRGERIASFAEQPLDLGSGALCIERDTSIVISNPGCPDLTVSNISISGNYFFLAAPRATPFVLSQGESETVHVGYSPTGSGSDIGRVQITTDADNRPVRTIPLSASTQPIDHISFRLVQENGGLKSGDTAIIGFIPDRDWSGQGLKNLDFSIITNGNLLTFINPPKQADQTFQTSATLASLPGSQSILNVQLKSPTEIVLHKDKPLVEFQYITALSDTTNTPILLSLLSLNNADPNYLNCILSPASEDGDFTLNLECGGKTLIDFMNGKMPVFFGEAHPNPVTSQTNYQASLSFTSSVAGVAEVCYYDALGKLVQSETITLPKAGNYDAHFDRTKISGGNYEYVIRLKDQYSNSARGRIVLLK